MTTRSNKPQTKQPHETVERLLFYVPADPTLTASSIEPLDGSVTAYETRLQLDGRNAHKKSFDTLEAVTLDFVSLLYGKVVGND